MASRAASYSCLQGAGEGDSEVEVRGVLPNCNVAALYVVHKTCFFTVHFERVILSCLLYVYFKWIYLLCKIPRSTRYFVVFFYPIILGFHVSDFR